MALNLVLVLLLTLVPAAALADVGMELNEFVSYVKGDDNDNAVFTFTPDKDGEYRVDIIHPEVYVSGERLVFFAYEENGATVTKELRGRDLGEAAWDTDPETGEGNSVFSVSFPYELTAGVEYKISFENNFNGKYKAKVVFLGAPETVVEVDNDNFPDDNFRECVSDNCDINGDGKLSKNEIATVEQMYVYNKDIYSIEGVKWLTSLKSLYCWGNHISTLPELPASIEQLGLDNNEFTSMPTNLPEGLKVLEVGDNKIPVIDNLPSGLETFNCSSQKITDGDFKFTAKLPEGLRSFLCYDCDLEELPELPSTLKTLDCSENQLTKLPELPASLTWLVCSENQLTALPELPANLTWLYCRNNELTFIVLNEKTDYTGIDVSGNSLPNYGAVTGQEIEWDGYRFCFGEQNHEHITTEYVVKEPTCTWNGREYYKCINCDYIDSASEKTIPTTRGYHDFLNGTLSKDEDGRDIITCKYGDDWSTVEVETGKCGDDLTYTWTKFPYSYGNDVVVVSGTGMMYYYNGGPTPFDEAAQIIFEEGITYISESAVYDNDNLRSVKFPSTLETISDTAFANCNNLESIELPEGLKQIGLAAFNGCKKIKTVTIPSTVTNIEKCAFSDMEYYNVAEANTVYKSIDGMLYSKDGKTLVNYPGARTGRAVIPYGTETIGGWAFDHATNLTSVIIPASVTKIESDAFLFCDHLSAILFGGTRAEWNALSQDVNGVDSSSVSVLCLGETGECNIISSVPFEESKSIGISICGKAEDVESVNVNINILKVKPTEEQRKQFGDTDKLQVYNISLVNAETGAPVELSELSEKCLVQVELVIPNTVNGQNCKVYRVESDGSLTDMEAQLVEGNLVFTTEHFSEYIIVEHEHEYTANVVSATCDMMGYTEHTCSSCGSAYKDSYVKAEGHDIETVPAKDATCTEDGYTESSTCKTCGIVFALQLPTPATGHNYVDGVCTKCRNECSHDDSDIEVIPEVAATCTKTGLTEGKRCSVCGEILVAQQIIPAAGHDYKNGKCTVCNAKDPNYDPPAPPAPVHSHSYTAAVTAPTCTEKGYTTYTCSCGDSYVGNYVDALGHTEVIDPAVAATCTKTGLTEGKHCSVCNEVLVAQTETPTIGHTEVIDPAVAATCTKTGLTEGKHCSACNEVLVAQTEVPKTAHDYKDGVCTVCGAEDPDYVAPVVNPFKDTKEDSPYYDAIIWAVKNEVTAGKTADTFGINDGCTRAQIVTFLYRAAGSPEVSADVVNPFTDVSKDSVYYNAIMWAVENKITAGTTATTFSPDAVCTRGQIVTFMFRASGAEKVEADMSFTDVAAVSYCYDAVAWAVANEITAGKTATTFAPNDTCTRGQAVTFIYRASK